MEPQFSVLLYSKYSPLSKKILEKVAIGEKIYKEEWVEWKTMKLSISMLSQVTGLPIDRMGRLLQKHMEEEVGIYY